MDNPLYTMPEPIFPEVVIGPIVYITIGLLLALVMFLTAYIYRLKSGKDKSLDLKQLKLPESRIVVLESIVKEGELQSRLPGKTEYSKSTVSQAITELNNQGLIKKKKRGNSYLIEANIGKIEEKIERV